MRFNKVLILTEHMEKSEISCVWCVHQTGEPVKTTCQIFFKKSVISECCLHAYKNLLGEDKEAGQVIVNNDNCPPKERCAVSQLSMCTRH